MESIRLDLVPDGAMPELHASQYDKGRRFRLNLLDFGIDYTLDGTETLTIEERKVDGNICVRVVANTFSGKKYVEFTTTEQMCACAGYNLCELHIVKGEDSIGTLNFILNVERSPIEGGLSGSEIENLYTQIDARVDVDVADIMDDYYKKSETYSSEEIDNALDLKANASDVYDKTEIDTALALKANTSDVNTALALKADKATTYNKTEVDNLVAPKADKSYVDSELATKADQATTYSKTEVDALINALPTPMVFKGTLGTGGTITTLPSASAENEGYTYKVITAGTYQGIVCKVGDVVTSNGSDWVLIPSGDTDSDTWRSIKINGTEKLGSAISSGAVDFEQGDNITITFDANGNKIIVATTGIYTKAEVDALIAGKCDYPTETASGAIASFNTDLASALKECEVSFTAYQASGTPTPSSPIPISGFSSATLTRTGANIIGGETFADIIVSKVPNATKDTSDKTVTYEASKISNIELFNKFKPNTVYTIFISTKSGVPNLKVVYTDNSTTTLSLGLNTTASGKSVANIIGLWSSGTTVLYYDQFGVLEGSLSAGDFIPYHGNTYLLPFGDTYYGGVLDVIRGKLRVTHEYKDLGSFTWVSETSAVSGLFRTSLTSCKWQSVMLCSAYKYSSVTQYNQINDLEIALTNTEALPFLRCRNTAYDTYTATQFKNAVTGVQLVYELKTPIEIDLTPEQIATLVGDNNVFCDIPTSSVEVAFKVSIEKYINDLLNP